ncbi:NAD(P)-dependent dehydrogenase (short-subunit alcohol dehydrogenase family) [Bradyrhizobium sp. GM24.11]
MTKTVLVTGGAGYVGSHCCKAFASAGWAVITVDNLSRGWRDSVRWGPLIECDIRDGTRVRGALETYKPDLVAHFAALAYVGESVTDPALYYANNTAGTLALLESMRAAGCDRILFSSTCASYGVPQHVPIDEGHPQLPINPYGWTKMIIERMLEHYGRAYGMASVSLRYFNAAGCDPDGEIGECHEPENPRHSADDRSRSQSRSSVHGLRNGLSNARWQRDQGLHPRQRPRAGTFAGGRNVDPAGRSPRLQSRYRRGYERARACGGCCTRCRGRPGRALWIAP